VVDDDPLFRSLARRTLIADGLVVTGEAESVATARAAAHALRPDALSVDIGLPDGDGIALARELTALPWCPRVVLISWLDARYYEDDYALELIGEHPEGVGYLLKKRVGDVEAFVQAVARVAAGGSALDPEVVGRMLGRRRTDGPLQRLSPRERDVLAAMAEGKSNQGIAKALVVTEAAVEKHVTGIFHKVDLGPTPTEHRRVLAVLTYLRASSS
jgi:DNA-binding NarL/FixJ family response regulator